MKCIGLGHFIELSIVLLDLKIFLVDKELDILLIFANWTFY